MSNSVQTGPERMCTRCVLSTAAPLVTIDGDGICNVCREYEAAKPTYDSYFRGEEDLIRLRDAVRDVGAEVDCLLLYSGGKDSTYVLYRLVDLGFRVLTFTLDNGYLPDACLENIRQVCAELRVRNVTAKVGKATMDAIFSVSLERDATVCSGCFRALTARSTELAIAQRIPMVVTGLSRGQIFHTKLHQLLSAGISDAADIDSYLRQFRREYHGTGDEVARYVDDRAIEDRPAFERTRFEDFFRYSAVTKQQVMQLISERATMWRRPLHVGGCSTNCMINDVGIQVHIQRKGFHNYMVPLAWDVRFGHLSRSEAIDELRAEIDTSRTSQILRHLRLTHSGGTAV